MKKPAPISFYADTTGGTLTVRKKPLPSLSGKLYSVFIVSFIIPILLICVLISYLFSSYQYQNMEEQAGATTALVTAYVNNYIKDIDYIMRSPYYHSYFRSKADVNDLNALELNLLSSEIEDTLRLTTYSRDDFGDLLILSNQKILYFDSENYYQYLSVSEPLSNRNWYTEALQKDGKIAIVPSSSADHTPDQGNGSMNFFISRKLKNLSDESQENIIMVNMKDNSLSALFSQQNLSMPSMILFTNDKGELIYSTDKVETEFLEQITKKDGENAVSADAGSAYSDTVSYRQENWLHHCQTLEKYPLTVHVFLSASHITQQVTQFVLISLLCYVLGLFIAYLFFRRTEKHISIPALQIKSVLKDMETGNLDARCTPMPITEFNEIGASVNGMATELQERIKNEYELSLAQKELQFQALQSQIQPHFIINTIYSFISLNQIGETELLNDAFYSFAHLLRYVLGRERETTIASELAFLENYCSLYKLRFGPRISYEISCEKALEDLSLPRLLLQPLVENAVIHGIEPSETPCFLQIRAEEHQDTVYLIIEDNGVGFTPEQIRSTKSIGIQNVQTRISLWNEAIELLIYRLDGVSIQILSIPKSVFNPSTKEA